MRLQLPPMPRQYMYQPTPFEMQRASMEGDDSAYMAARDRYVAGRWQHGGGVTVNTAIAYLDLASVVSIPGAFGKLAGRPAGSLLLGLLGKETPAARAPLLSGVRNRVLRTPSRWSYGNVVGALGETDPFGNITIRRNLSLFDQLETLGHEGVHQWLSPSRGTVTYATASLLQRARAHVSQALYDHSHFFRFTEEFLAERAGTGSTRKALSLAYGSYGIRLSRLVAETAGIAAGYLGAFGGGASLSGAD